MEEAYKALAARFGEDPRKTPNEAFFELIYVRVVLGSMPITYKNFEWCGYNQEIFLHVMCHQRSLETTWIPLMTNTVCGLGLTKDVSPYLFQDLKFSPKLCGLVIPRCCNAVYVVETLLESCMCPCVMFSQDMRCFAVDRFRTITVRQMWTMIDNDRVCVESLQVYNYIIVWVSRYAGPYNTSP